MTARRTDRPHDEPAGHRMLDRRTLSAAAIAVATMSCDAALGIVQYGGSPGDGGLEDASTTDESSSESGSGGSSGSSSGGGSGSSSGGGSGSSSGGGSGSSSGAVGDAGTAADSAVDAAFCASQSTNVIFCDDFDQGSDAAAGWGGTSLNLGTLTIDTSTSTPSPPGSLSAATDAYDGGDDQPTAQLFETFNSLANVSTTFTLDFDFRLDTIDPGSFTSVAGFELANPPWNDDPYLLLFSISFDDNGDATGELIVFTGSSYDGGPPSDMPTWYDLPGVNVSTWTHVTLTLDLTSPQSVSGNTFTVTTGGSTTGPQGFALSQTSPTPSLEVGIGPEIGGPTPAWGVHVDNVVLRSTAGL